ncbi:MAG: serine/threonine protein kinase [Planctomycetaceae bacterium]
MVHDDNLDTSMPSVDRVNELLDRWQAARRDGRELSPEELCRDCPEMRGLLELKIHALQRTDTVVSDDPDSEFNAEGSSETLCVNSEITDLAFHAKGGLGAVYRATEKELNREVAVKFLHRNLVDNLECQHRFQLEAEVTGRLEHPGVVPLYGIGRADDGRLFYYMRYIDGETLDDAICRFHKARTGRKSLGTHSVEFRRLLTCYVSVCRTIAYAHNRGIVHRDIKPANVMLGRYGETIVVDWGLAVPVMRDDRFRLSGEATLMPQSGGNSGTSSGAGVGTPAYMSPEQMTGLAPTPACDVYSLGATLYRILTGEPAFVANRAERLAWLVLHGDFRKPREVCPAVSQTLEAVCLKAMALQPTARYQTALELADDVENYLADAPVTAYPERLTQKIRRWARRHKAATRSVLLAAVAILLISFFSALRMKRLAFLESEAREEASRLYVTAEEARETNLKNSAGFLAQAIGYEIDRRWRLLETEVRSEELRRMVQEINANSGNAVLRRPLQSWLNDRRVLKETAVQNSAWCVYDADGIQVARSPRADSIGRNFRHRDYFHGFGRDLDGGDERLNEVRPFQFVLDRVSGQDAVYMSCVFESTNTRTLFVSFTAPIWDKPEEADDRSPIGVFSLPVEISQFDMPPNAMLFQLDNDPFEDKPGLIIAHPQLGDRSENDLPPRVSDDVLELARVLRNERLRSRRAGSVSASRQDAFIREFADPITSQVAPAVIEPIVVPGRPEVIADTGWFVVVREL